MQGTCGGEIQGSVIALEIAVDFSCATDWVSESFSCPSTRAIYFFIPTVTGLSEKEG